MWGTASAILVLNAVLLVDSAGAALILPADGEPATSIPYGDGCVIWERYCIKKLSPAGEVVWVIDCDAGSTIRGFDIDGGLLRIPGGDLLTFRYDIDSAWFELLRFNPVSGAVKWKCT